MDISIIVAFDNSAPLMENFIDQIMPFVEGREDRELVLVSDGCRNMATMEFSRACAAKWENVILVETPKKGGYSKANNAGVAASSGEYLLFANTDIFPEPDAIDLLRAKFNGNPKLGAAQGCLAYPQNGKVMCCGHTFNDYMNHHIYQGRPVSDAVVQTPGPRQALNSAFLMMPRAVYLEMGGMDEFFFNAYDGMDLTMRTGWAGYELMYYPDVVAWHSTGGSRDYIRHNNEYQSKYYYAHNGTKIRSDVVDYLRPQIEAIELAPSYVAIDCTFCMTWKDMAADLGISVDDVFEIEERDSSKVDLYRNVPPAIKRCDKPLLFVTNNYNDVTANKRWFAERACPDDLFIDFYGNAFTAAQLGLA